MKTSHRLVLISIVFFCFSCFAQVDDNIDIFAKQLKLKESKILDKYVVSKILPYETDSKIYVIPIKTSEDDGWWEASIYLIKYSMSSKKIIFYTILKNAIQSDAVQLYDIRLDTARYILNAKNRAFGVRLFYANNSNTSGFSTENLLLFSDKLTKFNKIMEIVVLKEVHHQGLDCKNAEVFKSISLIEIDKKQSRNNYFNIIEKIRCEHYFLDSDCQEMKKDIKNMESILQYDGNKYIYKVKKKDCW